MRTTTFKEDYVLVTIPQAQVMGFDGVPMPVASIQFQAGPIRETGENGCQIEDILRVCQKRLIGLNLIMDSEYNRDALHHVMMALDALDRRTADRERRGVEGTSRP